MTRIERQNVGGVVIVQRVGGDLRLRGRGENLLIVDGDGPQVQPDDAEQSFAVRCDGDCRITVPSGVDVIVEQVGGDAKLTDLGGNAEIGAIGGDLIVRGVRSAQIGAVGGDLRLKWAEGDVKVSAVGSDATIREVNGDAHVIAVGSDLYMRNIKGSCVAEQVGSDLVLNLDFTPGHEYRFNVGSDVLCRVEPDTHARFVLPPDLPVALDIEAEIEESEDGEHHVITLGEGSAEIHIVAGGELRLVGEEEDYMVDLGFQIEEELEARLSSLEEKLGHELEGLDERILRKTERLSSQAERFAERMAENAQRQTERAARQAERATLRMRRSMERPKDKQKAKRGWGHGPRFEFSWGGLPPFPPEPPAPPPPPHRPVEPVTEQERLLILKMVEDKKITIEEAERLLAALEGQG